MPPVCLNGLPTPRSRQLLSVFRRYYLPLQTELAQFASGDEAWLAEIDRLSGALNVSPSSYLDWRSEVKKIWLQQQQALERHQQAWQNLLDQCGLTVRDLAAQQG